MASGVGFRTGVGSEGSVGFQTWHSRGGTKGQAKKGLAQPEMPDTPNATQTFTLEGLA